MSDILAKLAAHRETGVQTFPIEIPEWDLSCFIRPLSTAKHLGLSKEKSRSRQAARLIVYSLVDASGASIFEDNAASLAEIESQPSPLVARISQEVLEVLGTEDEEDAKND